MTFRLFSKVNKIVHYLSSLISADPSSPTPMLHINHTSCSYNETVGSLLSRPTPLSSFHTCAVAGSQAFCPPRPDRWFPPPQKTQLTHHPLSSFFKPCLRFTQPPPASVPWTYQTLGRDSPPWSRSVPANSCWVCQERKVLTALYPSNFGGLFGVINHQSWSSVIPKQQACFHLL